MNDAGFITIFFGVVVLLFGSAALKMDLDRLEAKIKQMEGLKGDISRLKQGASKRPAPASQTKKAAVVIPCSSCGTRVRSDRMNSDGICRSCVKEYYT